MSSQGGQEQGSRSIQDIMSGDLFASPSRGDLVEALKFIEKHGTPIREIQVRGIARLQVLQARRKSKVYDPIIKTVTSMAKEITPPNIFMETIDKITMADKFSGKIRLNKMTGGDK